jgi:hypothetical protein
LAAFYLQEPAARVDTATVTGFDPISGKLMTIIVAGVRTAAR